ncbi:M16 family metallopeptidase [Lactobacillus gigeriorum]|uniref:Protease n=1 Tax=Lactobacillus gigeriorum DSM 23908 = CRBIP 24.85 TaxID=1423751 RepID=I7K192_9LACO|nr:pitrilysin family protein [Lactobacillus gigeriorum]KRN14865.1 protease [Lactobacillus gigeriorum DSM 23908 = CRBIP 24.85]CCI87330.1 Protease [Lactobacillus gigeriorum DSM 23908 = CRBIP 24.85]
MISPKIISQKYTSGFMAQIILRPQFNQRFFGIIVDFGSSDPQAIPGSAHFLEHKLFAKKSGDISHRFEELGADVNAMTSFNETMYFCSGVDHNRQLIELLFELVGEPYFTADNVAKEIPIIQQELAMYQDDPNWPISNTLMQELFGNSNLGIDVAGTKESIASINVAALKAVYQRNYYAQNMRFIACGDFNEGQIQYIFRLVGQLQQKYIKVAKFEQDLTKATGKLRDRMIVNKTNSNVFGLGINLKNFKKVLSSYELSQILLEIMLESKLGIMSPWFEAMKAKHLLANSLQIAVNYTRQGNFATIYGVADHSQAVIEAIKSEIMRPFSKEELPYAKEFFELQKKEWLAQNKRALNNIPYLAMEMAEELLDYEDSSQNLRNLQTMSFSDFLKYSQELLKEYDFCSASFAKKGEN